MSARVYRTLLWLYPKSFRVAYGDGMVAVFEEMRRDRSALALWGRVLSDAFRSVIVQRMESLMSTKNVLVPVALAAAAALVLAVVGARGVDNLLVFVTAVLLTGGLALAALVSWSSRRPYVEPSDELDSYWLRFLATGFGVIAAANIATAVGIDGPWLVLFTSIILGVLMVAMGLILGLWRGLQRVRSS